MKNKLKKKWDRSFHTHKNGHRAPKGFYSQLLMAGITNFLSTVLVPFCFCVSSYWGKCCTNISVLIHLSKPSHFHFISHISIPLVHRGTWLALLSPFLPFGLVQPFSQVLCWFPCLDSEQTAGLRSRSRVYLETQIDRWNPATHGWAS